ncbi:MAG: 3-phosphoglycerate dehydrogenase [Kordia sp.]|nr:MAG: 3-phosphoglycerate dehydrogenase [Kordia sp.]
MKILANDGISKSGISLLVNAGFEVLTVTVAQNQLANYINNNNIVALLVRSATKVTAELIDTCPSLKLIGRGGVGMDNIDVAYAKSKGLHVINTPNASSVAVAELVFAHLFGMVRFLHQANREMPLEGDTRFKELKKQFSGGTELRGKTLGIIGFGRIGKEVAKIAIGIGMKVIATSSSIKKTTITIPFYNGQSLDFNIETQPLDLLLKNSDFITLHIPYRKSPLIKKEELELMKNGVGIVNTSRGGVLDEIALINAIGLEKVKYAALDVYETEPTPEIQLLMNPELSLTPHIGGATTEAQSKIGKDLASQIIELLKL